MTLHDALGFYLHEVLHEGGAAAVACHHAPRA
jgi:hypothetical protein